MKTKFPRSALLALLAIGLGVLASATHAQPRPGTTGTGPQGQQGTGTTGTGQPGTTGTGPQGQQGPGTGSAQLPPTIIKRKHKLDECFFDGAIHTRNFGKVNYGPVFITTEELQPSPRGFGPRPEQVHGLIMPGLQVGKRTPTPEPSSGYPTTDIGVDPGHVMALHLGGPHNSLNIVPQWANWQRLGAWRVMERELDKEARKIADQSRPPGGGPPSRGLFMDIQMVYRDTGNVTPSLRSWAFPKKFKVFACPMKLDQVGKSSQKCDGGPLYYKEFEGAPDSWRP